MLEEVDLAVGIPDVEARQSFELPESHLAHVIHGRPGEVAFFGRLGQEIWRTWHLKLLNLGLDSHFA